MHGRRRRYPAWSPAGAAPGTSPRACPPLPCLALPCPASHRRRRWTASSSSPAQPTQPGGRCGPPWGAPSPGASTSWPLATRPVGRGPAGCMRRPLASEHPPVAGMSTSMSPCWYRCLEPPRDGTAARRAAACHGTHPTQTTAPSTGRHGLPAAAASAAPRHCQWVGSGGSGQSPACAPLLPRLPACPPATAELPGSVQRHQGRAPAPAPHCKLPPGRPWSHRDLGVSCELTGGCMGTPAHQLGTAPRRVTLVAAGQLYRLRHCIHMCVCSTCRRRPPAARRCTPTRRTYLPGGTPLTAPPPRAASSLPASMR